MRLNARNGAALLAIVVGLVLVVFAALGSKGSLPGTLKNPPPIPVATGTLEPLDPVKSGGIVDAGGKAKNTGKDDPEAVQGFGANIFDTEYGARGTHKVSVSIRSNGITGYSIKWRDGKSEVGSTSGLSRERTIRGGFPLVQVAIQGLPASSVTCKVTIDGAEKATKTTSRKYAIAFCTG
jgi:hypothetical protein